MSTHQIRGIILLLVIIFSAALYKIAATKPPAPGIRQAQLLYETEKLQMQRENLKRYTILKYYGIAGLFAALNISLLIIAGAYARAKLKASSVHTAHIGEHSTIPVHHKDLPNFYSIAVNLSLAEIEASASSSHDDAYRISRQMMEDATSYTRAIVGKRGMLFSEQHGQTIPVQAALPAYTDSTQTYADLLKNQVIAPGKPLVLGFHQGQPQYRSLKDLKSVAVAGWQGSGKTLSTAYIVASSILAYGVHAYIVDPHKNHEESLYSLIKPLEKTGHLTVINPFDTPELIEKLNALLDRRLSGQEPGEPGILLVIDELARLAKMEYFDVLVTFLERCTEETRKANMTFIGCSHKWTARHFKGRADIRGCMNSMLIHKTKPSQADLLVEDSQDKLLVKQIRNPGEAILVTDFDPPVLISMPKCTREDMKTVAEQVRTLYPAQTFELSLASSHPSPQQRNLNDTTVPTPLSQQPSIHVLRTQDRKQASTQKTKRSSKSEKTDKPELKTYPKDVIPLELHRKKSKSFRSQSGIRPDNVTVEQIIRQFERRKQHDPTFTQAKLAELSDISPGYLSKILRGQRSLSKKNAQNLYNALFIGKEMEKPAIRG